MFRSLKYDSKDSYSGDLLFSYEIFEENVMSYLFKKFRPSLFINLSNGFQTSNKPK